MQATYENVLFNADVANFVGNFTCEVSNVKGTNEVTVELNGWLHVIVLLYGVQLSLYLIHTQRYNY